MKKIQTKTMKKMTYWRGDDQKHRTMVGFAFVCVLALVLFCGLINVACAANMVSLHDGAERYALSRDVSYLKDEDGTLTLNDVMSEKGNGGFLQSREEVPNFSFTHAVYWFRLDLKNQHSTIRDWLMEIQYPPLDLIDVHVVYGKKKIVSYQGGDTLLFQERAIKHRNHVFKVALAKDESTTIYLRVKTESSLQLPVVLWTHAAFLKKDHDEQFWLALYYGIIAAMIFYNVMIFLSIRDVNYLYYLYYLLGWGLFQTSLNGLAFEYLWPQLPRWGNIATPFFMGCAFSGIMLFGSAFLQLKQVLPKLHLALRFYFFLFVCVMIASLFAPYSVVIKVATLGALSGSILVLVATVLSYKNGIRQAKFFMIAWTILLLGIMGYSLKSFGVLPNTFITEYGLQIGSALEVVLLSFALAHRMRILKEENERIQRDATELLEQRVQQRTADLDQALKKLSEANAQQEEQQSELTRFLAVASHDLRQPMHALNLYLGALTNFDIPESARPVLGNVRQCAQIMDDMFLALLDLSRLDAQVVEPQVKPFTMASLLSSIEVEFAPQARAKGLQLKIVPCSAWVLGDAALIAQILRNLTANAVRYTEHGKILIGCRRKGNALRLSVFDTGIGISHDQQKSVFEEFCQLGNASRDRTKGLGLGLAIVRRLARLLSTPITLESSLGKGSMFAIDLPCMEKLHLLCIKEAHHSVKPNLASMHPSNKLNGKLVVVVDDEESILDAMRMLLQQWNCVVITATSGSDAIAQLSQVRQIPDMLICDDRLRLNESGLDVIKILQREYNEDIPALIITGTVAPERIQEMASTGMPILHKPVNASALHDALVPLVSTRKLIGVPIAA